MKNKIIEENRVVRNYDRFVLVVSAVIFLTVGGFFLYLIIT